MQDRPSRQRIHLLDTHSFLPWFNSLNGGQIELVRTCGVSLQTGSGMGTNRQSVLGKELDYIFGWGAESVKTAPGLAAPTGKSCSKRASQIFIKLEHIAGPTLAFLLWQGQEGA